MQITKELEGKVIVLVNEDRLAQLGNGGEKLPADALESLSKMRVMRVTDGWVTCLPLNDEDKAVYDAQADSWDIEVPLVYIEVEECYEIEK